MKKFVLWLSLMALALVLSTVSALAKKEVLSGPIPADVLAVRDGDTILVGAHIWPGHRVSTSVRLAGIDTPELRGKCPDEIVRAKMAREFLLRHAGRKVLLYDVRLGKYAGRVVARVRTLAGIDMTRALLAAGHGREYDGRKRSGWCD